jgi:2-methylisocitrate lyase-like PEP mutase family enzyme
MPPSFEDLERICREIGKPVNALVSGPFASYTRADFARIGVARLSLGGSLARVTHRALIDAAEEMLEEGSFSLLKNSVAGAKVDEMLKSVES